MTEHNCYSRAFCTLLAVASLAGAADDLFGPPMFDGSGAIIVSADGARQKHSSLAAALEAVGDHETIHVFGRHRITPAVTGGSRSNAAAPLKIAGRKDLKIIGVAGAEIHGEGPGDFLSVEQTERLRIEGLTFRGNRPEVDGLFSMIIFQGAGNRDIQLVGNRFVDFGNHAISHLWGDKLTTNVLVQANHFYNGGTTNHSRLKADGAAISGIGAFWTVVDNHIENCVRGIEIEGATSQVTRNVIVSRNSISGTGNHAIMLFATGAGAGHYVDILIAENTIHQTVGPEGRLGHRAITITGGTRILVLNNVIRDVTGAGINLNAFHDAVQDSVVSGNMISGARYGIRVVRGLNPILNVQILDNMVSDCREEGIVVGGENLTVRGNTVWNTCAEVVSGGIVADGESPGLIVRANRVTDMREDKRQEYGIWIKSGVSGAMLRDNFCLGNQLAGIRDDGIRTDFKGNKAGFPGPAKVLAWTARFLVLLRMAILVILRTRGGKVV